MKPSRFLMSLASFVLAICVSSVAGAATVSNQVTGIGDKPVPVFDTQSFELDTSDGDGAFLEFAESGITDFGTIFVSTIKDILAFLTNSGSKNAVDVRYGFNNSAYSVNPSGTTCGSIIAAGETCALEIRFAPDQQGQFSDTLIVDYRDNGPVPAVPLPTAFPLLVAGLGGLGLLARRRKRH